MRHCTPDTAFTYLPAHRPPELWRIGNVQGPPRDSDPDTVAARRFWSATKLVPIGEAAWFSELVAQARQVSS